ncbi:MAG: AI-2E family transporter [Cyclobacteriaceae bacterium]|nr:AI-2E family transporter [Cyclobacteriaceae bacterium]
MSLPDKSSTEKPILGQAIEIAVRLGLLAALLYWCLMILKPFIPLLIWGVIIAVATYPFFQTLNKKLGNRNGLTATLIALLMIAIIIVPCVLLADSLLEGIHHLRDTYEQNGSLIPPPDDRVKSWPAAAKPVVDLWTMASKSTQAFVVQYKDQLADIVKWTVKSLAGIGIGILEFIVAVIVSAIMLAYSKSGGEATERIFIRLIGRRGQEFVQLTETTIRQVVKGILGVAFIQTILASIGFFVAGVPAAGLWAVICLVLAIVQIGVGPVVIPLIIYIWSTSSTLTAILFTVWSIMVLTIDNILKPWLLGKGAPVPMLVIFLGAIGGFMAVGFVGLFLGAVILSLTYKLAIEWVAAEETTKDTPEAPLV